jgi:hypothetical protein
LTLLSLPSDFIKIEYLEAGHTRLASFLLLGEEIPTYKRHFLQPNGLFCGDLGRINLIQPQFWAIIRVERKMDYARTKEDIN